MSFPPNPIWRIELPSWVSLRPVRAGSSLVIRIGNELRALDPESGAARWAVVIDPEGTSGNFLAASGDLILSDRRPDPRRVTQIVGVKAGKVVLRADLRCMVAAQDAAVVAGGRLVMVGHDPSAGDVFVVLDLNSGKVPVDVLLSHGANALVPLGDRYVLLNRIGSPGLYSIRPDGTGLQPIEKQPGQDMKLSGGRLLATLANDEGDTHQVQARDAASLEVLWTAPAQGPACGLDPDTAVHTELQEAGWVPVVRDAASGGVRWRGKAVQEAPARILLVGPYVIITESVRLTAYRRENGEVCGEMDLGRTAVMDGGRIYVGGFRTLVCANVE